MGSVRKSLAIEVLNQDCIIKFLKWTQEYIMSYHTIWLEQQQTGENDLVVTPKKIEKLVKEFKTYQCVPRIIINGYRWREKRKKEKFMGSVRKSLAIEVLNQDCIIKFLKWTQEYIMSYQTIWLEQQQTGENDLVVTPKKIEKLVKEFKTYQCALDFEYKYIQENSPPIQFI